MAPNAAVLLSDCLVDAAGVGHIERKHLQSIGGCRKYAWYGASHGGDHVPSTIMKELGNRLAIAGGRSGYQHCLRHWALHSLFAP